MWYARFSRSISVQQTDGNIRPTTNFRPATHERVIIRIRRPWFDWEFRFGFATIAIIPTWLDRTLGWYRFVPSFIREICSNQSAKLWIWYLILYRVSSLVYLFYPKLIGFLMKNIISIVMYKLIYVILHCTRTVSYVNNVVIPNK